MKKTTENVRKAILDFIKGGDNRDVTLFYKVLHPDFKITKSADIIFEGNVNI